LPILLFLLPLMAWLGFGERGFINLYRIERERQSYLERIRLLRAENQALLSEVNCLRTDLEYAESVARRELNLIRENEIIFRFKREKPANKLTLKIPPRTPPGR